MLDIRKIRENPDFYRERLARRNSGDEKLIERILALDEDIRKSKQAGKPSKASGTAPARKSAPSRPRAATSPRLPPK